MTLAPLVSVRLPAAELPHAALPVAERVCAAAESLGMRATAPDDRTVRAHAPRLGFWHRSPVFALASRIEITLHPEAAGLRAAVRARPSGLVLALFAVTFLLAVAIAPWGRVLLWALGSALLFGVGWWREGRAARAWLAAVCGSGAAPGGRW